MTETEFRKSAQERGFSDPTVKEWPSLFSDQVHTHERDVYLLVIKGRLSITIAEETTDYFEGDCCHLKAETPHFEQTGSQGATTLIALK
ncbi:MAG: cupin domain-containing protein [Gammaproteobacteria bacterium]|nr:cupin domain-containing protein [Gammaproteobacteria bacterium]